MNHKFSNEINESRKKLRRCKQEGYVYSKHAMNISNRQGAKVIGVPLDPGFSPWTSPNL